MQVRSRPVFIASLLMLFAAGGLGGLLVHDGEVGTDEAKLAFAGEGDQLDLKGTLISFEAPATKEWAHIANLLDGETYLLHLENMDHPVLATGMPEGYAAEDVVISGTVLYHGAHPEGHKMLIVIDVSDVAEPLVFKS